MQAKNYCVIGVHTDEEGTSLVRVFLAKNNVFAIIKSDCYDGMTGMRETVEAIDRLGSEQIDLEYKTIDILCNFTPSQKRYTLDKSTLPLRIRNTFKPGEESDIVRCFLNVISDDRLRILPEYDASKEAIKTLRNWDREKSENPSHYTTAMALLHSIGWLESQLIRHQMV